MKKTQTRTLHEKLKRHSRARSNLMGMSLASFGLATLIVASLAAFILFSPWFYMLLVLPLSALIWSLSIRQSLYSVARSIENRDSSWNDRLSIAVDLSGKKNPREVYSSDLTEDYITGIERRVSLSSFSLKREKKLLRISLAVFTGSVIAALAFTLIIPARLSFGYKTIFAPGKLALNIQSVTPDTLLVPGQHVSVEAVIESPVKLGYVFLKSRVRGLQETRRVRIENGRAEAVVRVDAEQVIHFERFGLSSKEIYLGLRRPFEISNVEFTALPPLYTGEKPRSFSGVRFSALPGSMITVHGTASAELKSAGLNLGDSMIMLQCKGRDFAGEFYISSPEKVSLVLTSRSGGTFSEFIEVTLLRDEVPLVEIFNPGRDQEIDRSMTVLIGVHVLDDYGLGSVRLASDNPQIAPLTIARPSGETEDTVFYRWDLSDYNLLPGDEIVYYIKASDNDFVSGPKWGQSRSFRLRFPGMAELFSDISRYGTETAGELSSLSERQEGLDSELSRLEEKLRTEQRFPEADKQRLREIIEEQKNLLGSIDSLAKNTKELLANLEQGALSDPKTLEQIEALSQMLAQLMPPELHQKLAELAMAINQNPQSLAQTLGNMSEFSTEIAEQLEQALNVLEKFIEEQRLAELAEKASALARMEDNLIRESSGVTPEEAAARQRIIEEGIKELARESEELSASLSEKEISQQLSQIAEAMAEENTELSKSVEQSLQQGSMNQRKAGKLSENLRKAGLQFAQLAANLQKNRQQSIGQEMANLARELLVLSEEQEKILASLGKKDNLELATRATEMERAIERKKDEIFRMAGRSFNVPRDAMHSLAAASRNGAEFKQSLIKGETSRAKDEGKSVLHEINLAAASLLEAFAQNCCGQASSSGLEQLMESLSSLSLAQLSLNQQMGGILPLPISMSLSEAQRQALSQLAAEQGALRRQIEELKRSAGQDAGLSGMLEGIIEDMQAMEEDLSRYVGTRELVDRGEQVFRKLLDARNVLRKRDDEQRREREIGTLWENLASPTLPDDSGERRMQLKKELIRFLGSDYPESYKRIARQYLMTLLEEE